MLEQNWIGKESEKLEKDGRDIPLHYLEQGIDLYKRMIDFNYQFIIFIGLIAGFGFSAFDHVHNRLLFFSSELIMFCCAFIILFWTRKIYFNECLSIFSTQDRRTNFFKNCSELLKISKEKEGSTEDEYKKYRAILSKQVFQSENNTSTDIKKVFPIWIAILFFIATILLLVSFLKNSDFVFLSGCHFNT